MSEHAERPRRFALLIGAMKSGTTSLHYLLGSHPEVARSAEKEPAWFVKRKDRGARGDLGAGPDAGYFALWPDWDPARHRVALEASTHYTKAPRRRDGPERVERFIATHGADVRFLYVMRHPLERIASELRHAATSYPQLLYDKRRELIEETIAISSYASQLDPWVARFGRDRVLLLSFDELMRDGQAVLERICRFLAIDPTHRFDAITQARNTSAARPLMPSVLARTRRGRLLWKRLPPAVKRPVDWVLRRLRDPDATSLGAGERREAIARLLPELERLEREYGFDTGEWRRDLEERRER